MPQGKLREGVGSEHQGDQYSEQEDHSVRWGQGQGDQRSDQ